MLPVTFESRLYNRVSFACGLNLLYRNLLAFQLLVIEKKASQHEKSVGRHFVRFAVAVELWIGGCNSDNLVVLLPLVDHRH